MAKSKPKTTDAVEILHRRYFEGKPEMMAMLAEERANADVARKIYALRTAAGLKQSELARLINTTASVISRLEDADYEGHSMSMLHRIAAAVGKRVEMRFVPAKVPTGAGKRPALLPGVYTVKSAHAASAKSVARPAKSAHAASANPSRPRAATKKTSK